MNSDVRLCEVLDKLLEQGIVISGDVSICVAGIELIYLRLGLVLTSSENLVRVTGKAGECVDRNS